MRLFGFLPVVSRRVVVALGVAGMLFTVAATAQAQDPAAAQQPAAPAAPDPFKFDPSKPAMVMISVKPGTGATLEAAFAAVKTKMAASEKAPVVEQGKTMNLLKLDVAPTEGQPVIYIVMLETPSGGSYNIQNILDEIGEWRADSELYKQFSEVIVQWAPWPLVRK